MDFDLDDQQRELRDTARRFLEKEAGIAYARAMMDDPRGYRDDLWAQMAAMGWTAVPFAEADGGLGLGFIGLSLLLVEMGRVVLPGPFLASVALGGSAIAVAGDDAQRARWLPGIASGETIATLTDAGDVVERDGSLHGEARFVLHGADAGVVVTHARAADGTEGLYIAEPSARTPAPTMDATRRAAHLRFDAVPAERLARADAATIARVRDRAAVAVAAEILGAAERVLELSVTYAGEREQFGRPIGSFQAIKHRAADMLVDVESLRNAVSYAAWAVDREHPEATLAASAAKAFASDAGGRVARSGIQIHGGIGFTWEHDMHLFFKRIAFDQAAFGDASEHRERLAASLGARAR